MKQSSEKTIYGNGDSSFQAAGGEEGLRQLVDEFYNIMESLPEAKTIRAMHPQDLTVARDKLMRFLSGWLGGPRLFTEKYGPIHIPQVHSHLPIGEGERDAWLKCMELALVKQPYAEGFKTYLLEALFIPAERCRMASSSNREGK